MTNLITELARFSPLKGVTVDHPPTGVIPGADLPIKSSGVAWFTLRGGGSQLTDYYYYYECH